MNPLSLQIEALIFAAEKPILFAELKVALEEALESVFSDREIEECIETVISKYEQGPFAIEVVQISEGFTFMTKPTFHATISSYLKHTINKKLSKAALETLSIVAYKQPVAKSEIESIRGVNCDYAIQKLLEKELIEISGRSSGPGKPLLYTTSEFFMNYFGLKSIEDLPKLKEFETADNAIGEIEA